MSAEVIVLETKLAIKEKRDSNKVLKSFLEQLYMTWILGSKCLYN